MVGIRGRFAATAAMFVVGSLILFAPGAQAQKRSAAETAEHGERVSRDLPFSGSSTTVTTGSSGGMSSTGVTSDGGAASAASRSGSVNMNSPQQVMAVQRALNDSGADLKVDGKMGPNTRRALMDFQARNGLPVSGRVDGATAAKLGV